MLIYDSHAELIYNLIISKKPNAYIYLPNNIKVVKAYDNVTLVKEYIEHNEYEIELINYINLPNGKNIEIVTKEDSNGNDVCRLDSKEIHMPLNVRTRQIGDKMDVKGMLGTKKLKDIFIDEKIPAADRDLWPIVVDSSGKIIWIPGLKKSKLIKDKRENHDIIIKYY